MRLLSSLFIGLFCFSWSFLIMSTHGIIQPSQKQVLLQLRKQLEYPKQLDFWFNATTDLCYLGSTQVNVTCQDNFVSELRIVGDKPNQVSDFHGYVIPTQTLSENFSMDSLVATLSRLTSLRALSLVSLGIWGPFPEKIYRLNSLEHLDLSWNFMFGSIPPTVSRLANLQTITLDGNYFNATFPDWFGSIQSLTNISLRDNEISGKVPDLSSLHNLKVLILSNNKLDSGLPKLPKDLEILSLANNSFSGEIPKQYSQLHQLQQLDISFNTLQGNLPSSLLSLPNLIYLNLTFNMLTGSLPVHLECGSGLEQVDISNNKLRGFLPSCLATSSDKRVVKYSGNCLLTDLSHQHPETYCIEAHMDQKESKKKNLGILIVLIGGSFALILLLACGLIVLCRKCWSKGISEQHLLNKPVQSCSVTGYPTELLTSARFLSEATKLGTEGLPAHRLFTFSELKEATKNFDKSTIIGNGSTGKLYKGRLENGTLVAIRKLTVSKRYTIRNLKLRLDLLARPRHHHLVCLLGHYIDNESQDDSGANTVYLVYEFVRNGTYSYHLSGDNLEKILDWSDRLAVLTGIAKAVHFLHTGLIPGFFNNRLKAHNILLNEHGMPKLSDYGLSIVAEETENNDVKGEGVGSWQMKSLEDDVYNFGFILLESLVGPSFTTRKEEFRLNEMASFGSQDGRKQMVDPIVLGSSSQESLSVIISITNKCFSSDPSARPSFEDVLWHLQYAAQVQATKSGDQKSDSML